MKKEQSKKSPDFSANLGFEAKLWLPAEKQCRGELTNGIASIELSVASKGKINHRSVELLARGYEYLVACFARGEDKNRGQFYSPSSFVPSLVGILAPYKGRIYDPQCSSRFLLGCKLSNAAAEVRELVRRLQTLGLGSFQAFETKM